MLCNFSYNCWPFICFVWRNVCSNLSSIVKRVSCLAIEFWEKLNILEINSLSDKWSANIPSYLFILLIVSFVVQFWIWENIDSPEISLCIYNQLIFDKSSKNMQQRKDSFFNNGLGKLLNMLLKKQIGAPASHQAQKSTQDGSRT